VKYFTVRVVSEQKNIPHAPIVRDSRGMPKKDFSKYWGSIKTGLSIEEIDNTLQKMRK
jgi:hypothetical protein